MHVSSMAQNHSIQTEPTQQFSTHCGWTNSKTVLFTLLVLGITLGAGHHGFAQERRIYVPVSELDTILSQDKQGVVLPADEFDKLLEKAKQNDGSPAKLLVSNISYDAKIQGSQLLVDATVQFEQFEPGWHTLQLKTGGLAVESATLGKDQPPIGRTDSNNIYLLTNEPGEHSLKLSLSTPLASVGSDLVAAFSLPRSSAADFRIDFPAVKQLVVDGAAMNSVRTGNAVVRAEFAVGGRDKIELRITDQKRAQQSEATVFTTTAYGVNIAPSEITWQAVATLQSFGESLDKFVFSVPAALEIAAVESTGLESWTLADSANRKATEITLNFRQPVDGRRKITFRGVMAVPVNEQWSLPGLRLKNAASEIGRAIVRHPVGTRLVIESMAGIRRSIAANNSSQQQLSQAAFDIWQPDFNLELRLQLREREVLANMSTIVDVSENTVRFETLTAIECLNAPLFEVTATLPTDWEPTAILLNDKSVPWQMVPREPGRQYLRIPFPTALKPGGENNLTIRATQNLAADESGNSQFAIPQVGIDGAGVVEGVLLVRCQPFQRITPEELTGLDPTVLPNTKSEHPGFRYQEPEYSGTVRVTPKPTRLTAWTQSFTRLDPDRAITWLDLHIDASGGGLREFTVKLPESVGDRLRFSIVENCSPLVRIREQIATEVADGQRTWIIRFDRRIRGSLTLGGFLEEDRTEDGNRVPEAIVQNADRQYGFIATEASAEQHLTFNIDQQAGLQPVDAADLPPSTYRPDERIVAAYRYVKPGVNFTAMEERFDREAVPTAVCNSLKIQTIIGQAGQLRHRTAVDFVAVGVQNIRMLLPANTDLWSTELNGEPIEVRRDGNAYLIRLSPTEQPDTTQQLEVTYESEVDPLRTFGRLQQAAPTFSVEVSGIEQPIEVLARSWNVLHSSETVLDASSGLFEPKEDLGEQSPLAQIPNLLQLPNQRNATDKLTAIAAVVLIVLLPTLCFRRFGLPGLVGCAAVGLILMFAFSGILSTQTKQAKFAADAQVMPSPQTMSPYSAEMKPLNRVEDVPYDGRGRVTTSEELASPTRRSQEVAP
ncbi:MAG: hypothetical protein AB8G99_24180, partial [Planctomycetaceae bacterium]